MSRTQSDEIFRERICFIIKERVTIGERRLTGTPAGIPPRIIFSCARSEECARLRLPCKILNQEVPQYPFDLKVSLKLNRLKTTEVVSPLPWRRRLKSR